MDVKRNGKRIGVLLTLAVIAGAIYFWEEGRARLLFAGIIPFPESDYWETLINALLRDAVILIAGCLLFLCRKRIPDLLMRYFPAVVLGAAYLGFAWYMHNNLALDPYFLTALGILAGLVNNILPVVLAALWYYLKPSKGRRLLFFAVYFFCALLTLLDIIYFW